LPPVSVIKAKTLIENEKRPPNENLLHLDVHDNGRRHLLVDGDQKLLLLLIKRR
jgi:hypothetical protein